MSDTESGEPSHSGSGDVESGTPGSPRDAKKTRMELYKAALSNDWGKAEMIYESGKMKHGDIITSRGETALHVAALAGHLEFVENLVQKMSLEDIKIASSLEKLREEDTVSLQGNTAFHCAVISGNVEIAKAIIEHGDAIVAKTEGVGNRLPILMASEKGNEDMVRYLYHSKYTHDLKADEVDKDVIDLFLSLIKSKIYDIALLMAKDLLSQKKPSEQFEEDALQELAQIPLKSPGFLDRCIHLFSPRQEVAMHRDAVQLVELLWDSLSENEERVVAFINSPDPNPIIEAAKRGNFLFLSILISIYPDALFTYDRNNYSIVHHAILNRHVDIFKFIHLGSARNVVAAYRDREGRNMLHLAAMLAPPGRLNIVPGAALQLQRELLWFEEVKKVMETPQVNEKIHYLSEFPRDEMAMLIKEMWEAIYKIPLWEGIFEKLSDVFERENIEFKVYRQTHQTSPKYILLRKPTNKVDITAQQSSVLLLFKKLKMVMEQENDEFEHYTQLWEMLDLFQEISAQIDQHESNKSDYGPLINKVKAAMRQHSALRDYFPLVHLWDLLEEFDGVTNRYKMDPDNSQLIEDLRKLISKYSQNDTRFVESKRFIEEINAQMHHFGRYGLHEALMRLKKHYFEDCPQRRTRALNTMLELFEEIDDLIDQYELDQNKGEEIFQKLKDKMKSNSWKDYLFNKKVTDLLQEMNKVMEQHELKQNHNVTKEYTPHDVFVKEHTELMAEGERWMRDTANSCMIVAVLITTIAFAAVITVPGGNADDGFPIFSSEILFKAFAIADSISMISSAISLLNFLSILTARYTIDDFRWSLPNKLFVGLLTIFVSIVAMMVAFVLSIFIVFKNISPLFSILIAAASAVPVALFMWQHSGLFLDVFGSTYASYFLFKSRNNPSSVFKRTSSSSVEHKKNL